MISIIPIRAFKDNYIWMMIEQTSNHAWVVDPGEAKPVMDALKNNSLKLSGILLTHHHADHSGGIQDLLDFAGEIPVVGGSKSPISSINRHIKQGDAIQCNSVTLKAIEIPGHTLDHTAYHDGSVLFCGDTLFSAGCGRIFEGTASQMFSSLQSLAMLPDNTLIYCGHEYTLSNLLFAQHVEPDNQDILRRIPIVEHVLAKNGCTLPSRMGEERKINPFLRCDKPSVIQAVEKYAGQKLANIVDVFHHLREWKNSFK